MKKSFSIGIAGLGNVGSATVKLIQENSNLINARAGIPIKIVAVSARRSSMKRKIKISEYDWENDVLNLSDREDIDAVVELIGGADGIAKNLVMSSLQKGKTVITANKALLASHSTKINKIIMAQKTGFYFEAAVASAIPIINVINTGISSNQINHIKAILNGTCNFILSDMKENNSSFIVALKKAQKLGFAESNPNFDIEGVDAAQKLSILGMLAFGVQPKVNNIYTEGIEKISNLDMTYSERLGYSIKLFCIANLNNSILDFRVHPALITTNSIASHVRGALNAVFIEGDYSNKLTFIGEGAGPNPTASSVVSDIINAAKNRNNNNNNLLNNVTEYPYKSINERVGPYYIRFLVADVRGVIASITSCLNKNDISLDSIIQDGKTTGESQSHIVVITHKTKENNIIKAIALIRKMDTVLIEPQVIRVEEI